MMNTDVYTPAGFRISRRYLHPHALASAELMALAHVSLSNQEASDWRAKGVAAHQNV